MGNSKYIELAKKLYELSKRGVDGEKENAKIMLNKLMEKHGISIQDLEYEQTQKRYFTYKQDYEIKIIKAIMFKVLNVSSFSYYNPPKGSKNRFIAFDLTDYQYLEACGMIEFYSRDFKNELDIFIDAYIIRQRITSDIQRDNEEEEKPLTREQEERNRKIINMAMGIDKKHYLKQLK